MLSLKSLKAIRCRKESSEDAFQWESLSAIPRKYVVPTAGRTNRFQRFLIVLQLYCEHIECIILQQWENMRRYTPWLRLKMKILYSLHMKKLWISISAVQFPNQLRGFKVILCQHYQVNVISSTKCNRTMVFAMTKRKVQLK